MFTGERLTDEVPDAVLLGLLPPGAEEMAITAVQTNLRQSERLSGCTFRPSSEIPIGGRWAIDVECENERRKFGARVWLVPTPHALLDEHRTGLGVDEDELRRGRASAWTLGVSMRFGEAPLLDLHWLIQLLFGAAGEPLLVIDVNACRVRRGAWLREAALAPVPPHPTTLFTVHAVGEGQGPRWLHTHGLDRCGSIELEMLDVPANDTGVLCDVLNAAAMILVERGVPAEGEVFEVGQDMPLAWIAWPAALKALPPRGPGGPSDRFEPHDGASGVLAIPHKGWFGRISYKSPSAYLTQLHNHGILYYSDMETKRAALLAQERWPRFQALFDERGHDPEQANFMVKLGYETRDGGREHLWFHVHEITARTVIATCLNEPFAVEGLKAGIRGTHSLERLSGFTIACPDGNFGPDDVHRLETLWTQPV